MCQMKDNHTPTHHEILFNLSINFSISSADTSINSTALLLHSNRESCGKYFNDLTKTIFEHHKFPIEEMFYILKERDIRGR